MIRNVLNQVYSRCLGKETSVIKIEGAAHIPHHIYNIITFNDTISNKYDQWIYVNMQAFFEWKMAVAFFIW